MPGLKKRSSAFTILELMLAMMIFTIMGITLYSMMDALTRLQASSLGLQRYMNEGHNMLDKLTTEISLATTEPVYLVDPENTSQRKSFIPEFVCTARSEAITFFEGINNNTSVSPYHPDLRAKQNIQQLFYTIIDHFVKIDNSTPLDSQITEFLANSSAYWNDILIKERIFYMTLGMQIGLYVRTTNVDGKANVDKNGGFYPPYPPPEDPVTGKVPRYQPFCPMPIYHIEYLFWGNKSKSWADDGSTSSPQPIRSWDSGDKEERNGVVIHEKGELPRAMKILLTLNYNPEMYDKRAEHLESAKDQLITLERVVIFKNYKKPEAA